MSDSGYRKNVDELDAALRLLDHELEGLALDQPLRIRAIGGYALMKHGVREEDRATTIDIDTVTKTYEARVLKAIEKVAEIAGLHPEWLNNDNVDGNDPEQVEHMLEAEWEPQPLGLRNIAVEIGSLETLTRAKMSAVDDSEFIGGRAQDAPDLAALLRVQGLTSQAQVNRKYPELAENYPMAADIVRGFYARQGAAQARPELADVELDPYGLGDDEVDDLDDEPDDDRGYDRWA